MIRRPPRSTQSRSSAASDVYKRQILYILGSSNAASHLATNLASSLPLTSTILPALTVNSIGFARTPSSASPPPENEPSYTIVPLILYSIGAQPICCLLYTSDA